MRQPGFVAPVLLAAALTAAACSASQPAARAPSGSPAARMLTIVAGENVWGSIASQLAGQAGRVISIVSNPNTDPHTYESSASTARAFAGADYVILNGAGYDAWAERLLSGNPNRHRKVLTVAALLGKSQGDNPHFWYNPEYVTTVMDRVEADLESLDPADTSYFDARRQVVDHSLGPSRSLLSEIKSQFGGAPVASTESIFVYLAQYLGLDVISPKDFMNAVAEGNDPPAPSVARFQDEITGRKADLLAYNEQTATEVTTNLRTLATRAGMPVVGITETIQPPGATFGQWFEGELQALQHALASRGPAS